MRLLMKSIKYSFILILLLFIKGSTLEPPHFEQLKFHLYYLNLHVATLEFQFRESTEHPEQALLTVFAKATPTAKKFFPVDNRYALQFNKANFLPDFIKKQIDQKNVHYTRMQKFDHLHKFVTIDSTYRYEIPEKCFDYFSLLYFLRFGDVHDSAEVFLDGEAIVSKVFVTVSPDTHVVSVPAGDFQAYQMRIHISKNDKKKRPWKTDLLTNRLTKPGSDITIFFSADSRRLPLKVIYRNSWTRTQLQLVDF